MVALLDKPRIQLAPPPSPRLLTLENGDRLTRPEFERRYDAMPALRKAEFIEGVVQIPSPIRVEHMEADLVVLTWLGVYVAATPGVRGGGSVRLDADNEVQPDALLRIDAACGGQSRVAADGFIEGAPGAGRGDFGEHVLDEGRYVAQTPDEQGVLSSRVFPGLRLPVAALLDGKLAEVLAAVQQGIQTPEHTRFVTTLSSVSPDAQEQGS